MREIIKLNQISKVYNHKQILDQVKEVTYKDLSEILESLDRELVKGALGGEKFREYFFADCKCQKIAETVEKILD